VYAFGKDGADMTNTITWQDYMHIAAWLQAAYPALDPVAQDAATLVDLVRQLPQATALGGQPEALDLDAIQSRWLHLQLPDAPRDDPRYDAIM
jgi:Fe-S-cluster formation regulator IscX/YfhJ